MFNKIKNSFKNLEKVTHKIMSNGLKFCFSLCLVSIAILLTYDLFWGLPLMYHMGLSLFKLSITFGAEFIICGFVVDGIKNQLI